MINPAVGQYKLGAVQVGKLAWPGPPLARLAQIVASFKALVARADSDAHEIRVRIIRGRAGHLASCHGCSSAR